MMKPTTSLSAIRATTLRASPALQPLLLPRHYATQNSLGTTATGPKRRKVTPFNDDGFVPWNQLSSGEKAARATQQSFNFGLIAVGLVLTTGVAYFMWTDVFSPDSKISQFNRAVDKIKQDPRCLEVLGDRKKITAHGEETFNKWRRARPVASSEKTDAQGNQHLIMHWHVDGPLTNAIAQLHMVKYRGHSDYEYKYLYLDARGHERIYLENAETSASGSKKKKDFNLFGVKWS
ncbi:hypothetical protein G7046_g8135 [Stylonectria norvegica]|nr:hypothetical protein G7046_g8135 [Stylonectria norvegica]